MTRPSIVVGFNDSDDGRHALATALELARRLDAGVNVVHVATQEDYPVDPDRAEWELEGWRHLGDIREAAERLMSGCRHGQFLERRGDPATVLHQVADDCDALMIIVGLPQQGDTGWVSRLLTRPVSRAVTRHLHRPVLLVPQAGTWNDPAGNL